MKVAMPLCRIAYGDEHMVVDISGKYGYGRDPGYILKVEMIGFTVIRNL